MSEKHTVRIDVYPKPYLIEVDPDEFGRLFAHMNDDDQVQVLAAMELHMRPHRMQWDFIAIELEKDENSAVLEALQQAIPVDKTIASLLARIAELEEAHRAVSMIAGNLSDETLMAATGPNDAAARGIMVVNAREISRAVLNKEKPNA